MHSSTIVCVFTAAMAFLATPALGAPAVSDLAARSAELDARAAEALEVRAAALVCQLGGVKACTAKVCPIFAHQISY